MKLNTATGIILSALIPSLGGFILSATLPQNKYADPLMTVALFAAAASGIIASVFSKKLLSSKQWNYLVAGTLLLLLGILLKKSGLRFMGETIKVIGGLAAFTALGFYIYLNRVDFKNSKWIWFVPFILLGCFFRFMYWTGGNVIIFCSLLLIVITALLQLVKQNTRLQVFLLAWQIAMCICMAVFYFHHLRFDTFIIGYIFLLLALVDIFLCEEKA